MAEFPWLVFPPTYGPELGAEWRLAVYPLWDGLALWVTLSWLKESGWPRSRSEWVYAHLTGAPEYIEPDPTAPMIEILHRSTKAVLYRSESAADLRAAVVEAVGAHADLAYADLAHADLAHADLTDANLDISRRGSPKRSAPRETAALEAENADLRQRADAAEAESTRLIADGARISEVEEAAHEEHHQRIERREQALRKMFMLVEEGMLVRDISRDHEVGWAIRQVQLVQTLAEAKAILTDTEGRG